MSPVSVIIPAYDAGRTLRDTLESVARQTAPVAEIIVVDDGSRDDTAEIARSFKGVQLLMQNNAGPGAAINAGAALASGGTLIFLDADDILTSNAISSHLDLLDSHVEADGAVGYMEEFVCPSESIEAALRFRPRERQPCWLAGGVALRAEAFRGIGSFDVELRVGHWIDWMDRAKLGGLCFRLHETIVLRRRLHSGSLSMRREVRGGKGLVLAARNAIRRRKLAGAEKGTGEHGTVMKRENEE